MLRNISEPERAEIEGPTIIFLEWKKKDHDPGWKANLVTPLEENGWFNDTKTMMGIEFDTKKAMIATHRWLLWKETNMLSVIRQNFPNRDTKYSEKRDCAWPDAIFCWWTCKPTQEASPHIGLSIPTAQNKQRFMQTIYFLNTRWSLISWCCDIGWAS